jgi:hypothetical protein
MHHPLLNDKRFTAGKKFAGKFFRHEKNSENIFPGARQIHKRFFEKYGPALPTKTNSFPTTPKPGQPPKKPISLT